MSDQNQAGDVQPFSSLMPEHLLDALESVGLEPDGRIMALNSYENRVYQFGVQDGPMHVVKFYRAGRWSDAAIEEEHAFTQELAEREIPVVPPSCWPGAVCSISRTSALRCFRVLAGGRRS